MQTRRCSPRRPHLASCGAAGSQTRHCSPTPRHFPPPRAAGSQTCRRSPHRPHLASCGAAGSQTCRRSPTPRHFPTPEGCRIADPPPQALSHDLISKTNLQRQQGLLNVAQGLLRCPLQPQPLRTPAEGAALGIFSTFNPPCWSQDGI